MRILVTGANGFLGSNIIDALQNQFTVSALSRGEIRNKGVNSFRFRSIDDPAVEQAMATADIVIHTAAQLHGPWDEMHAANVLFTRRLVELSAKYAHKKFIYISTENVTQGNTDIYSRTKQLGEEEVQKLSNVLILRPTIIYGPGDTKYITRLRNIIRKYPVIPVLGSGKQLFQFVYVDDLVTIITQAIRNDITGTYTVAGPDCVSYNELMKELMRMMNVRKPLFHIPVWMLRMLAHVLNVIFKNPPLTPTQLDNLAKDRQYDISENVRIFAYTPVPLRTGLEKI